MPESFFSQSVWQKVKTPLSTIAQCGACGIHKTCQSSFMKWTGKGRKKILICAEAPGEREDRKGVQLVGHAGNKLAEILYNLGIDMRKDCWLTNALICRPKDDKGGNRTPLSEEINFCRPNLTKTLKELDPDIVIPLGRVAIQSILPLIWKPQIIQSGELEKWVGWRIPSIALNSWICPTYHPAALLHERGPSAMELHFTKHLATALQLEGKPYKQRPDYASRVKVEMDHHKAAADIRVLMRTKVPLAVDLECTTLKPDGKDAQILCCSVSDGKVSIGFPWIGEAIEAIRDLTRSDIPLIASNLRYEERWFRKAFGKGVKNWGFDTVLGAHWRRCIGGICSLKFQSFVLLGVEDYNSHLEKYMEGKDPKNSNSPNRLREVEPEVLMKYCALDSLYTAMIAQTQQGMEWD